MRPTRILFIEDDEIERQAFLRMVRDKSLPWEVTAAGDLAAARSHLAGSRFDVIVADNHLPDGESTELFGEIQDIPFVLVTGTLQEQLALRTLERGADDYLLKDAGNRHLEALPFAVEKTLYRKAFYEEKQRLTRELQENERRLRTIFENAASGIIQLDEKERLLAVNDRLCEMLGFTREELLGKSVHDLTYPEDRPRTSELNARIHDGRLPWFQYEKRYLKKDGSPLWVHVAVSAARDENGRFLYSTATIVDISSRKAAEAQVRLQAAALEASPDAISVSDSKGTIIWVNAAFTKLTGYRAEEVIGRNHRILNSGKQDDAFYKEMWETIERGGVCSGELVNRRKDGTLYREEIGITPLLDEQGKTTHYVAATRDTTDRRKAEEALRESEERFRAMADDTPVMIWVTDPAGKIQFVNRASRDFFGPTLEAEQTADLRSVLHPDDVAAYADEFLACLGERKSFHAQARVRRHDGQWRWIESYGEPRFSTSGEFLGMAGSRPDITVRKEAENALRASEERLRKTMSAPNVGVLFFTLDGRIHEANAAFERMSGYSTDELRKLAHWMQMTAPEFWDATSRKTEGLATRGEMLPYEKQMIRKDGARWWGLFGPVRLSGSGAGSECMEFIIDITDRKLVEAELAAAMASAERAKAAAEHANRTKDHFLAVLSHELRTPLTPVMMGIAMLQEKCDCDGTLREVFGIVRQNIELEARLIDDLLDVTRIARGKIDLDRSRIELRDVIRRAIEICQPDIEARRLHFGVDLGESPYWVDADPARLQQVFWNLLKNAIKFTPHSGCVGIRCRSYDEQVLVEVVDSGIGIEPEALPKIFDAFEQAERSITRQFGGLGLGLAISKALVEMHGGKIEAQSKGRQAGALFRVLLPLSVAADRVVRSDSGPSPDRAVRPLRILLVEDHGVTAQMIRMVLAEKGHRVEIAGDMAAALELVERHPFDLLLSDLGLPDGSGHDLIRELRARGYRFPAIALSGYGQEEDIRRSYQAGFGSHLTKPASREAIDEAVARTVG